MEPAKIDWKTIESKFVVDDLYEDIKAPKWVDLSAPSPHISLVDDDAWFCKPDCNHPKSVEDLINLKLDPKVERSAGVSKTHTMCDQNRREPSLKRRPGLARPLLLSKKGTKSDKFAVDDGENVNPNLHPTISRQYNSMKLVIESSTEKKKKNTNTKMKEISKGPEQKQLKSTLSARNLFGGRDIVNQITEFCSELKRLATRGKERDTLHERTEEGIRGVVLDSSNVMLKEDEFKMKAEDTENSPLNPSSVDLSDKKKRKNKEAAAPILTCPPSPQCFSAGRSPTATRIPPLRPASKSRLQVRGILQELDLQKNKESNKENHNYATINDQGRTDERPASPVILQREAPPILDVFWFLKPCTRLST